VQTYDCKDFAKSFVLHILQREGQTEAVERLRHQPEAWPENLCKD
jgi:hypothetical protein